MQETRSQIVGYLKEHGCASVQDLTEVVGLTPMTVRHHLTILESEGLVNREKERARIGRPRYVYFLTEAALSLFPERYDELAGRLLNALKEELGSQQAITQVLERMAHEIAGNHRQDLDGKSLEERLDTLINVLGNEGFLASWEEQDGEYTLTEYSCPYFMVGQEHPEICHIDWQLITTILDTPVKRRTCMLNGDTNCKYRISEDIEAAEQASS